MEKEEGRLPVVLLYGASGWIGGMVARMVEEKAPFAGKAMVVRGRSRVESYAAVAAEIKAVNEGSHPDAKGAGPVQWIFNCAGATGRPNVDWCEAHEQETLAANLSGPLMVARAAADAEPRPHVSYFGTGCIYSYCAAAPPPAAASPAALGLTSEGFREEDAANFTGSLYSYAKAAADAALATLHPEVLVLRPRMPISDRLDARSLVTKLLSYERVVNVPNSMTVLHDLLPIAVDLAWKRTSGTFNLTNPGAISHNEVLGLYKEVVDPSITWENFSQEEHDQVVLAPRSNNLLCTAKLQALYPSLPPIHTAVRAAFERMAAANAASAGKGQ